MKLMVIHKLLFIWLLTLSLGACKSGSFNEKKKEKIKELKSISYSFGDASTSPNYHRSYSITANKDSVVLVVNSYADILATKSYPMEEGGLEKIAASILKNKISKVKEKKEKFGCTGGTSKLIAYSYIGSSEEFKESAYYCGGTVLGTLGGNVDGFLVDFMTLVPDLTEVINSTKK